MLEWCAPNEDLKKCDSERPDICLASVMRKTPRPLRRQVLRENQCIYTSRRKKLTSGVPYVRFERKAVSSSKSYFSAKPKSTSTGTCSSDNIMFAGLSWILVNHQVKVDVKCNAHLRSLWTTPREWRNWTPERSDWNHSLALCSGTSTGTSSGRYSLKRRLTSEDAHLPHRAQAAVYRRKEPTL
jgi:hypothetical protein